MSENPFEHHHRKEKSKGRDEFYSARLKSQFEHLEVGQSMKADLLGRSPSHFRSMLTYAAACLGVKFKTKANSSGDIWVKRIW